MMISLNNRNSWRSLHCGLCSYPCFILLRTWLKELVCKGCFDDIDEFSQMQNLGECVVSKRVKLVRSYRSLQWGRLAGGEKIVCGKLLRGYVRKYSYQEIVDYQHFNMTIFMVITMLDIIECSKVRFIHILKFSFKNKFSI